MSILFARVEVRRCRVLAELRHAASTVQNASQSVWVTNADRRGHYTRRARCRPSDVKRQATGELRLSGVRLRGRAEGRPKAAL